MLRKCICLVAVMGIIMGPGIATAAEPEGSLQIVPHWCGRKVSGGIISIAQVGSREGENYRITDGLANWTISEEEALSGSWLPWLIQRGNRGPSRSAVIQEQNGACFSDLQEGLYLAWQTEPAENTVFDPFLLTIPEAGSWNVVKQRDSVYAGESPRTGDHPAPIIGAMGIGLCAAVLMVLVDNRHH